MLLAAAIAAMALWLWHYAKLNLAWGLDELLYRHAAQYVADDFTRIFALEAYDRGIQRFHLLLIAPAFAVFERGPEAFEAVRLIIVAAYLSAAIPVWLLARGAGLRPAFAAVAAVAAVLTPWAVYSLTLLTEPVGFALLAWCLWALWRAADRPAAGRDVVLLVVFAMLVTTRVAYIVMAPLLPLVLGLQTLRYGTGTGRAAERLRRLPAAAWRRHRVVTALTAAGAAVAVVDLLVPGAGIRSLLGAYGPPGDFDLGAQTERIGLALSRVSSGLAFLPVVVGAPWLLRELIRPSGSERHAFALVLAAAVAAVLVSTLPATIDRTPELERYHFYLALPIVLAAAAAIDRFDLGRPAVVAGGAFGVWLALGVDWSARNTGDLRFFFQPAESFLLRVVHGQISVVDRLANTDPQTVVAAIAGAAALAVAALARTRAATVLGMALAVALVANGFAQTSYTLRKYVYGAGMGLGAGLAKRSWVDRALPADAVAGMYAVSRGYDLESASLWSELSFFNLGVRRVVAAQPDSSALKPPGIEEVLFTVDPRTGAITTERPLPRYLVASRTFRGIGLDWDSVAVAEYLPLELMRLREPPQALWTSTSLGPESVMAAGRPLTITFFRPRESGPWCAAIEAFAAAAAVPAEARRRIAVTIRPEGGTRLSARVRPGQRLQRELPLEFGPRSRVRVRIEAKGSIALQGGGRGSLQMSALSVARCTG